MEYTTGSIGRIIAARFSDGEGVYAGIEEIARRENIESGVVFVLGGARRGGVVVGPRQSTGPIEPMTVEFDDAREIVGVGTLHRSDGEPALHLHGAIGRGGEIIVGCPREGLDVFLILEVFIIEATRLGASRRLDPASGLRLLALANPTRVKVADK